MLNILKATRIIPVITVETVEEGLRTISALAEGGLRVIEVTLRTPAAMEIIEAAVKAFDHLAIGAGTVFTVDQVHQASDAGAAFGVSPGLDPTLIEHAHKLHLPYLPGVQTATDIQTALKFGTSVLKFYPAAYAGGVEILQMFQGPFKHVKFCPTGGISEENAQDYLKLPNVLAVGGSWIAPALLIKDRNWGQIKANATRAHTLNDLSS